MTRFQVIKKLRKACSKAKYVALGTLSMGHANIEIENVGESRSRLSIRKTGLKILVVLGLTTSGAALMALGTGGRAHAVALAPESWRSFRFTEEGQPTDPSTFEFTAPSDGAILKVTDVLLKGDVFDVFDFGTKIGSTSLVPDADGTTQDPDVAFASPEYSHGSFSLGTGSHSVSITPSSTPYGGGDAFIRWDKDSKPVPEPITILGSLAAGSFGVTLRRKYNKQEQKETAKV